MTSTVPAAAEVYQKIPDNVPFLLGAVFLGGALTAVALADWLSLAVIGIMVAAASVCYLAGWVSERVASGDSNE